MMDLKSGILSTGKKRVIVLSAGIFVLFLATMVMALGPSFISLPLNSESGGYSSNLGYEYAKLTLDAAGSAWRDESIYTYKNFLENMPKIMAQKGVGGALEELRVAAEKEELTYYQCHEIAHLIGYVAYGYYAGDKALLAQYSSTFCLMGYHHGVEMAVTVEEYPNFQEGLHELCEEALQNPSFAARGGCYHGAGHSALILTHTYDEALELCDTLAGGPREEDIPQCYAGVFSEDVLSKTGLHEKALLHTHDQPHGPVPIENADPFLFCAELKEKYQASCISQVAETAMQFGSAGSLNVFGDALSYCAFNKYDVKLQAACIYSMTTSFSHRILSENDELPFYEPILQFPRELRHAYLSGSSFILYHFMQNGTTKDWQSFCVSFERDEAKMCTNIVLGL